MCIAVYTYVAFSLIHATKSEDRQHSAWPLQIDSGAETGLVNLGRRFRDRMLLMIGNFSIRYVREQVSTFSCMCVCMCTNNHHRFECIYTLREKDSLI